MRPPRLGTLLIAACLTLLLPASASAIPIHRHVEKTIYKRALGEKIPVDTIRFVEVVNVAPRDSDNDGVPDRDDGCPQTAGSVNGCPPATTTTSYSAPALLGGGAPTGTAASVMACESTNNPTAVDPSGTYHGAFQFDDQTWTAASGLSGHASDYDLATQTQAFNSWYPSHPTAWPVCG